MRHKNIAAHLSNYMQRARCVAKCITKRMVKCTAVYIVYEHPRGRRMCAIAGFHRSIRPLIHGLNGVQCPLTSSLGEFLDY